MKHKGIFLFLSVFGSLFLQQSVSAAAPIAKPTIKLATTEWPPYVGQQLPGFGYIYAIIKAAFVQEGYEVSVQFMPWVETVQVTRYGNDGYFPEYKNNKPNQLCSDPLFGGPVALYRRKDSPIHYTVDNPGKNQAAAFMGLKNYRFGVVDGYTNTVAFDTANYLTKVTARDDYNNLKNLANQTVDLAFTDVFVAEYLKDQHAELAGIVLMSPSLQNEMLYVCFSTQTPQATEKLNAFNRGLQTLKASGELQSLMDKYSY